MDRIVENVAILRADGAELTTAEIDDIVAAARRQDFQVALKADAPDSTGAPALGWLRNLRRRENVLLADIEPTHDSVADALRNGRFRRFASEVYHNLRRAGQVFKRALKSVVLVGAQLPALPQLVPTGTQEFAASEFEALRTYTFGPADEETSADRVHHAVQRYRAAHPAAKTYSAALEAVLDADAALRREYADLDWDPTNRRRWPIIDPSVVERVPSQAESAIDRGEAGYEIHKRVMQAMRAERGLDYWTAFERVLADNPALAAQYRGISDGHWNESLSGEWPAAGA